MTNYINGERRIPFVFENKGNEKKIVIISHGFGSSKESPTAVSVAKALNEKGIGAVRFDFPAHGESEADGEEFRVKNCLDDLQRIEEMVAERCPEAEIGYFSSSFGAFINLIYLSTRKHKGKKSFLRCSAVDMPGIMKSWLNDENTLELKENGFLMFDENYVRPLKVTKDFYEDLEKINLFEAVDNGCSCSVFCESDKISFPSGGTELRMIHGMADETAPYNDALEFSEKFGIELISVAGGDHRFTIPGAMDKVRTEAVDFFGGKK